MQTIRDLLARDLSQKIEEIIKVDQADEPTVYQELTEYVVTGRIRDQFRALLRAIADGPGDPQEGIGVWVSGFFGSGKSSFAKILGYILANRQVLGKSAADLFLGQAGDERLAELLSFINVRIPTEVVMFDVSGQRDIKWGSESITEIMYTVLLRTLGYAEDFNIAELEIELEQEGKLDHFVGLCREHYPEWRITRKGAQKYARASRLLHLMDPVTYPAADQWFRTVVNREPKVSAVSFVERAFELMARRSPGRALVFIIDEVGQYASTSRDKIENLRAVVESFGKHSKNMVLARKVVAPFWVVVTAQEKLEEVVSSLDLRRVEIARLQDRFKHRVDMAPADIREVATKRVLAKREEAQGLLRELFQKNKGSLNAACRLERSSRSSEVGEDDFVQFYPYLPHFIELSIDIVSGIRLQSGATQHLGGSNRTIIKQAHEMLVSERTRLADRIVGTLVTLDRIYELVEQNLSTERHQDITDIESRFAKDPQDGGWAVKAAKVLCLLEFVRDLPRTEANLAALMVPAVGSPAPLEEVRGALKRLETAQFIRQTDQGYKLQSTQEKNWNTERQSLAPKPKDRNEIMRESLTGLFTDHKTCPYTESGVKKTFNLAFSLEGVQLFDGQIPVNLVLAEDAAGLAPKIADIRSDSRQKENEFQVYWVTAANSDIDGLVLNYFASREMVNKYRQIGSQGKMMSTEERSCLDNEAGEEVRLKGRLKEKIAQALENGSLVFQGNLKDASALGKTVGEVLHGVVNWVVPYFFPKLGIGARPLTGKEAEEILRAANLSGLSPVFYGGSQGLDLVGREGAKPAIKTSSEVCSELLGFLKAENSYGNRVTGRDLENRFGGLGYGWERDLLRLVMATFFRAAAVEVTHQGQTYRSFQDPGSHQPFTSNNAFKNAAFAPRIAVDLKTLTAAEERFEELTGRVVDVDLESVAQALRQFATEERKYLYPLEAKAQAHDLACLEAVVEYRNTIDGFLQNPSEDLVRTLAAEGRTLKKSRGAMQRLRTALTDENLAAVSRARLLLREACPLLVEGMDTGGFAAARDGLENLLASPAFYERIEQISDLNERIFVGYSDLYRDVHTRRSKLYAAACDEIRGLPGWNELSATAGADLLEPLLSRACADPALAGDSLVCTHCRAGLKQMESDLAACPALREQAAGRLRESFEPPARCQRVRVRKFFAQSLESPEEVEEAVARFREHLLDLVSSGMTVVIE